MHEQQSRMAEEIEDLRSSLKKTVEEAVIEHKKSGDVGLIGSILTILYLCNLIDLVISLWIYLLCQRSNQFGIQMCCQFRDQILMLDLKFA